MPLILRLLTALVLLVIAAFCAYGFLATFEPPGHLTFRMVYGTIGLICLVGAVCLVLIKPRRLS